MKTENKIITIPEILVPKVRWVASALSTDVERRVVLTYLYATDGKLVATDGRRLHMLDLKPNDFELENGLYSVVSSTAKQVMLKKDDEAGNYAHYEPLLASKSREIEADFASVSSEDINSKVTKSTGKIFKNSYIVEAIGFGTILKKSTKKTEWDYSFNLNLFEAGDAILIETDDRTALVMPMREIRASKKAA